MNILDYAMEFEQDSETYYRGLAERTSLPGLKKILVMLADEEVKHYTIIKNLAENVTQEFPDSDIIMNVITIFSELQKENRKSKVVIEKPEVEIYRKALEFEAKSRDFYKERAAEAGSEAERAILMKLAEEEQKHYRLVENLIEFTRRPDTWLEDAEFHHLEEY